MKSVTLSVMSSPRLWRSRQSKYENPPKFIVYSTVIWVISFSNKSFCILLLQTHGLFLGNSLSLSIASESFNSKFSFVLRLFMLTSFVDQKSSHLLDLKALAQLTNVWY